MTKYTGKPSRTALAGLAGASLAAAVALSCKTTVPAGSATKDAAAAGGAVSEAVFVGRCGKAPDKIDAAWYAPKVRPFLTDADVEDCIKADLDAFPNLLAKPLVRYLTLTHLYNMGDSPEDIARYRGGVSKLLNSLSSQNRIKRPVVIDPAGTIVRLVISDYGWKAEKWTAIFSAAAQTFNVPVGAAEIQPAYPFRKALGKHPDLDQIYGRGDYFVAKASIPPLYHLLLDLPTTDLALEAKVLNAPDKLETDILQGQIVRSGFNNSGVSANNRLIERHDSPVGAYWKSYDFPSSDGVHNFFVNPFGPCFRTTEPKPFNNQSKQSLFRKCAELASDADFLTNKVFRQGGGEVIFNLPNKLQAYYLINAVGNRLSVGPANIVANTSDKANNFNIINGLSCMYCHFAGMIASKPDQLGAAISGLSGAGSLDWFKSVDPQDLKTFAEAAFQPQALSDAIAGDSQAFATAELAAVGPDVPLGANSLEPVNFTNNRYQATVSTPEAAAELGIAAGDFIAGIENADIADNKVKQQLLQFTTVDAVGMSRFDFEQFFPQFVAALPGLVQAAKPVKTDETGKPIVLPCPAGLVRVDAGCWLVAAFNVPCTSACSAKQLTYDPVTHAAGLNTDAARSLCAAIGKAVAVPDVSLGAMGTGDNSTSGIGCCIYQKQTRSFFDEKPDGISTEVQRYCACQPLTIQQ